mgnify:CR=1 FL=1
MFVFEKGSHAVVIVGRRLNRFKRLFPASRGNNWNYRSTTADGKQSEFSIKVLSEDKENGNTLYLVETVSTFQPIHDWYSKPSGWVLLHREEYVKAGTKAEFSPTRQLLKNPLTSGDSWALEGQRNDGIGNRRIK